MHGHHVALDELTSGDIAARLTTRDGLALVDAQRVDAVHVHELRRAVEFVPVHVTGVDL
jgi:hypothetical protein